MNPLKYRLFIDYLLNNDFLNRYNRIKGIKNFIGRRKEYFRTIKILKKMTSWLPEDTSIQIRMRYILHGVTQKNIVCPCCSGERYYQVKNSRFSLTCAKKDDLHQNYINKISLSKSKDTQFRKFGGWASSTSLFKINREKTNLRKYGVKTYAETKDFKEFMSIHKQVFNAKRIATNIKRYGSESVCHNPDKRKKCIINTRKAIQTKYGKFVTSPGLINLKNLKDLNKEFIELNFIDQDGHFLLREMQLYFGFLSNSQPYLYLKNFNIKYNNKSGGFNPDKPATLYYIYDPKSNMYKIGITNKTIEERFGKAFCSERAIAILEQTVFEQGYDALIAEQEILEAFKYARCVNDSWPEKLGGKTEFFKEDILNLHNPEISML